MVCFLVLRRDNDGLIRAVGFSHYRNVLTRRLVNRSPCRKRTPYTTCVQTVYHTPETATARRSCARKSRSAFSSASPYTTQPARRPTQRHGRDNRTAGAL